MSSERFERATAQTHAKAVNACIVNVCIDLPGVCVFYAVHSHPHPLPPQREREKEREREREREQDRERGGKKSACISPRDVGPQGCMHQPARAKFGTA